MIRVKTYKAKLFDKDEYVEGYYLYISSQNNHYILTGEIDNYPVIGHPALLTPGFKWYLIDPETLEEKSE